ncbi:hypothetical protein DY000_02012344 [Brassica cretica]|uniref:SWIM-type domain-containing protein n=1 Tax=Brassica cretica TaxID=69181 RepID=A0ABQ7D0H5_BRACR|nr:hypothetical protein DY000_02012344 [Brassica cretica]
MKLASKLMGHTPQRCKGYKNRFQNFIRYLPEMGDEVIVVTTHEGVPEEFYGAKVIGYRSFPCPWYQKVPLSLALSPRIISEIARFKPDIIHASSPGITVKLGELEAELFVIKAINDNWGHIESGRDPENYFKYSVQDIERIVLDFFDFFEETMKEEDWRGNKDSVVQISGVGDMSLKRLLKDGFVFEHDFLQVVDAVHIGWILLFVFICGALKTPNINLEHGKCDCGVYAVEKIPCSHAIAAGTSAGLHISTLVCPVYSKNFRFTGYSENIYSCVGQQVEECTCFPPDVKRGPGRMKKSRWQSWLELSRMRERKPRKQHRVYRCSKCKKTGHTKRQCKK